MPRRTCRQMDIKAVMTFAHRLMTDPVQFWQGSPPEARPRIQAAIYPDGLRFSSELIGTAEASMAFSYLTGTDGGSESMVRRAGLEPATLRFEA